jgi:phage I-like protein
VSSATNPARRSTADRAARLDALPGARTLAPLPEREPPAERRIFPAGPLQTTKGTFQFTPRSAESVMAAHRARGVRSWYDFNHQGTIPGARAPAAAFMDLEVRDSPTGPELWAVNIRWADDAAREIRQGNWGYDSAWFLYDPETLEVTELCNVALTNDPATLNLPPLVAGASRTATLGMCPDPHPRLAAAHLENTMADEADPTAAPMKCAICAEDMQPDAKLAPPSHGGCMEKMMGDMTAKMAAAGAVAPVAAGASLSRSALLQGVAVTSDVYAALARETNARDLPGMLGAVRGWKAGAERAVQAEAALSRIQGEQNEAAFNALVEQGKRDGKLAPAEIETWVKDLRGDHKAGVAFLSRYLPNTAPKVMTLSTAGTVTPPVGDAGASFVGASDIKQLAILGTDVAGFVKHLARMAPGGQAMLSNQNLLDAEVARVQAAVERYRAGERDTDNAAA